ncbi:amino acid permease [Halodesulfovibrio marinisediminis]|uniref:Tyrosine-specific transport protein n=1 Tax=Halodesulfovibrio marinisediminis DSM 17456 TaxID=1121457 RepID=A0A1N6GP47_9BACT|nr:aromatic amino acid transport family protein [Halodesulfovibrio marinisediminis]SIO09320.1 tyrosine-specific transport protein [Halodesulfovibrio marinisediminis DSM 17456]
MATKAFSAGCIVAGSTIGAGMLGLPMAVGYLGFTMSCVLLVVMWALALYSGLLLVEVDMQVGPGLNFNKMVKKVLGWPGQVVAVLSLGFLLYALLVAYITGMGSILANTLHIADSGYGAPVCSAIFALIMAFIVFCGTKTIVRFNNLFFIVMVCAMSFAFFSLSSTVNFDNLLAIAPDYDHLLASLPILFAAYGYHFCIPSTCKIVDGNKDILYWSIIGGTIAPLMCYVLWLFLTLGSVPMAQITQMNGNVDSLIAAISQNSVFIKAVLSVFASFALVTSFFGVSLSLYDLATETLNLSTSQAHRIIATIVVFAPPILASYLCPGSFIAALAHAGIGFAVLCLCLPCIMSWKLRNERNRTATEAPYEVAGGKFTIALASACGVFIIIAACV